jgi:hypothetical protein
MGGFLPGYGDDAFRADTIGDLLRMRRGVLFYRDGPLAGDDPKDLESFL